VWLDGPEAGAAVASPLGRALAQDLTRGLRQLGEKSPADVTAIRTLTRIETLRALTRDGSEPAAAKTFDGVLLGHETVVGALPGIGTPSNEGCLPREAQSVEYLGWTFSPRMRAMALFAAIAASPKPTEMSVILPS
jgi:hypothetical protein